MLNNLFLITLLGFFFCSCFNSRITIKNKESLCGADAKEYQESIFFKAYDESLKEIAGKNLFASEDFSVTSRGCIIVPKNFRGSITLKSEGIGALLEVHQDYNDCVQDVVLKKYLGPIDIFSHCGDVLEPTEMFIKISEKKKWADIKFVDQYFNITNSKLNELGCIKVPRLIGKVFIDESYYGYISNPVELNFMDKDSDNEYGFIDVCKNRGNSDPVIKMFSKKYGTNDCEKLFIYANQETVVNNDLIGLSIEDLSPLSTLENLKVVNLANNNITSLKPLKKTNISTITLENNKITFFDDLPDSVIHINISSNPVYTLKSLDHLKLQSAKISRTNIEIIDFGKHKESFLALEAFYLKSRSCDLSELENLGLLKADGTKCFANEFKNEKLPEKITELSLKSIGIRDLSSLIKYKNLRELSLNYNQIELIPELDSLPNLAILSMDFNGKPLDLDVLKNSHIRTLHLAGNNIECIEFIRGMSQLQNIFVTSNNIKDVTPIAERPQIIGMQIMNNPISHCPEDSENAMLNLRCKDINESQ